MDWIDELKVGSIVKTRWSWSGEIKSVDPRQFDYGQGVEVIRTRDGAMFFIHPEDILLK